ncbi:MAG: hypothetical protein MJ158_01810 [Alphaproteobacteria bacterium]|nr:hypothetical protein [Alphaproteobacteria bacterium]
MAIAAAKQNGNSVYVYSDNGNVLFVRTGTLMGFTGSTVSIQWGTSLYVYDETGNVKFVR